MITCFLRLYGHFERINKRQSLGARSEYMRNQAVVTPWVDFNHLEEVMIITTVPVDIEEALQ